MSSKCLEDMLVHHAPVNTVTGAVTQKGPGLCAVLCLHQYGGFALKILELNVKFEKYISQLIL